ncbi:gamma-glutamyltransferase [Pseudomonas sp. gcc21]|uniref:gamma-glutamyltransferase n=1 Tax=Pseudomonas sp. gcc21 TaxID=2726989 RepID=UPI001451622D|nr:gamma-glutamyltransferase [Pseudomonas sp. gcc21]QJD60209.1 gamma-glutamyltransferase [Pseudomonas sp. gcc21]
MFRSLFYTRLLHKSPAVALVGLILTHLSGCSGSDPATTLRTEQPIEQRTATRHMVSAAHPAAVEAGLDMLRRGGHAVDAAIAVQMVLGFIEAPETGIGGGGFLLLHDEREQRTLVYDGRETAPQAARPDRFMTFGVPHPRALTIPSGSSVGVPGLIAMLGEAHREHGQLPWEELFAPAITLAEQGLPMPPRLEKQIESDWSLRLFSDTRDYFRSQTSESEPTLRNPQLADTMRRLAAEGPGAFYQGEMAEQFVERVNDARWGKGDMTLADLADYRPIEREAVCAPYRQWTVCSAGPPSAGGLIVQQALGMLEHFPIADMAPDAPDTVHLIAEASRLAFADRNHYVGDPAFVQVPVEGLLNRQYLRQRAALIDLDQAMQVARPGEPGQRPEIPEVTPKPEPEEQGTSHFSVIDGNGNLVALTSSNEAPFGSRMLSQGFVINNQLSDFTYDPQLNDHPHPNAVGPGKRPRSSMAPLLVFDQHNNIRLVIGSRGGSRIPGYVLKTLIGVLDWEMDIQDAMALPNIVERGLGIELEAGTELEALRDDLEQLGHEVRILPMTSGLHGMERINGIWRGGADPRLDGVALGD